MPDCLPIVLSGLSILEKESDSDSVEFSGLEVCEVPLEGDFFVNVALGLTILDSDCFLELLERIVGGSCIGSPANISFLPLNIGIQQTWNF